MRTLIVLLALSMAELGARAARSPGSTEQNLKVAIIGDQGSGGQAQAVLRLIRSEGADMVLHAGDFDYQDNPGRWDAAITAILGADFPYFGVVGNHDVDRWGGPGGYQAKLRQRLQRISGAECTGELGVMSSCRYRGLFFVLSGAGTMGSGHESYIRRQLEADRSTWRIVSWHKNQREMQVGGKSSEVGWGPYEACRELGAIIATGHEHSYSRTKTLVDMQPARVDPDWPDPERLRVTPGATFAVVSGLGGRSIREQQRCLPARPPYGCNGEWASIYASNQGAQYGALFIEFHVNGDPNAARGYFKNIRGQVIDRFTITAGTRAIAAADRLPSDGRTAPVDREVVGRRAEPPAERDLDREAPFIPPRAPSRPTPRTPAATGGCLVSTDHWRGRGFTSQRGTFSVEFDMVPGAAPMNGITGLSFGRAGAYTDLAASVRFSPEGSIDSRNRSGFAARTRLRYRAGARYHIRMAVRMRQRTYDVYVTPPGGAEQALALNHGFRSEQEELDGLNHWALFASVANHEVCDFSTPRPDPAADLVAVEAPPPVGAPADETLAPRTSATAVLVGAGDIARCNVDTDEATAKLLDRIQGTIFTVGDNAYPAGTARDFQRCFEPTWGRHKDRIRPTPGNHDYRTEGARAYFDYFGRNAGPPGRGYYSYNLGAWHIVALNSNISVGPDSPQLSWLRQDLADHPAKCTLAYWHHARFSSGEHGNDAKTRALWEALYQAGADVILVGHDHNYERFAPQRPDGAVDHRRGIRQFVVGTGGTSLRGIERRAANSEVRSSGAHGVLKLVLQPDGYQWEFVPVAGKSFTDQGSGSCH